MTRRARTHTRALITSVITLLVAGAAAQRPPQFSFPSAQNVQASSQNNPFGDAALSLGAQDAFASLSQVSPQSSAGQQSPLVPLGIDSSSQFVSSQQQQQPQQQQPQQQSQQQQQQQPQQTQSQPQQPRLQTSQSGFESLQGGGIQLARPSLQLSTLSVPKPQPQAQQQQQQPQQSQPAAAPQTTRRQQQSRPVAKPQQPLQTQQTSQAANAGSQSAAIDAARKAEATAASLAAAQGSAYRCPDPFGYYRHHKSCDKYYACENGTATLKLCGNGLMFDDSDPKRENCAYPFSVDCGADRTDLEPPISTPHCPRLYGLFPDNGNCRVFYSCWNGEASKYECPPGLAYDSEQRVCVWADHVDRCDQSEVSDGFVCPDPSEADQPGHYTRHAHPTDCRKFYVCIESVARPYGCSFGTVFNVDSLQCDEPENVSGCEKYYGDLDPKLAKKLARENAQGNAGAVPNQVNQSVRNAASAAASSSSSSASTSG